MTEFKNVMTESNNHSNGQNKKKKDTVSDIIHLCKSWSVMQTNRTCHLCDVSFNSFFIELDLMLHQAQLFVGRLQNFRVYFIQSMSFFMGWGDGKNIYIYMQKNIYTVCWILSSFGKILSYSFLALMKQNNEGRLSPNLLSQIIFKCWLCVM